MKPTSTITYQCTLCPKKHTAPIESALALLAVCAACQAKRYAAGLKAMREAEAK